jgi:hypothetical protein
MEVRTIKNVDAETWKKFKVLAVREGVSMSVLLRGLVNSYDRKKSSVWGKVFDKDNKLKYGEAEDLEKISKKLRKERGFRV